VVYGHGNHHGRRLRARNRAVEQARRLRSLKHLTLPSFVTQRGADEGCRRSIRNGTRSIATGPIYGSILLSGITSGRESVFLG